MWRTRRVLELLPDREGEDARLRLACGSAAREHDEREEDGTGAGRM
jgi:hypothetical protein